MKKALLHSLSLALVLALLMGSSVLQSGASYKSNINSQPDEYGRSTTEQGAEDLHFGLEVGESASAVLPSDAARASIRALLQNATDAQEESSFMKVIHTLFFSKLSFDSDGGSDVSPQYAWKLFGRFQTPADPIKEGYTFAGWEPSLPARAPLFGNVSVKAKWNVNSYSVKWMVDGASYATTENLYGSSISRPNEPQKEGYSFVGWSPAIEHTMPAHNLVYTALWAKITEYVYASSDEEFYSACSGLVQQSLNEQGFNEQEALNDPYYFGRVIVNCNDFSALNFDDLEASEVIFGDGGTVILQFDNRDQAESCALFLNGLSGVAFAEADAYVSAPEDVEVEELESMPDSSWGEKYINADKYAFYLENNNFNREMTVAVVDSGVDLDHPFLAGRLSASGYNTLDDNAVPEDDTGHGTHVAGIVVDCTNNLNVKILPIRALSAKGGTWLSIVNAITYAANQKADVINLSLEAPNGVYSKYVEDAVHYAIERNCVVVAAAGNGVAVGGDPSGRSPQDTARVCPANLEEAIVVGALGQDGEKGYFSNYGASVDVIAPGMAIPSSYLNGRKALMWGTSQAAPHIAAVAAMFKLSHPELKPAQIEALIKQYCVDKGPEGRDAFYGDGCPDMYDAIPDCTVSFDSNGGSAVATKTTKNSSSVVLPTPTKSYKVTFDANGGTLNQASSNASCRFEGWFTTSSFSDTKHIGGESYMLLEDQTLYAKWTNGQLGDIKKPTRSTYSFAGWWTAASGGTEYSSSSYISSNMTLYAHWNQNPLSDWTVSTSVPSGTTVEQSKAQYNYQDKQYTEGPNASLSGWNHYDTKRTGWGGTVGPVYSDPSNGSRNVWSEPYVVSSNYKTVYRYWRYCKNSDGTGGGQKTYSSTYKYRIEYVFDSPLTLKYTGDNSGGYRYYYNSSNPNTVSGNYYVVWLVGEEQQWVSDNYGTRWYYQDPIYTYYFWKWSDWHGWQDAAVSSSSERNVTTRTVCRFRYNADQNTYGG